MVVKALQLFCQPAKRTNERTMHANGLTLFPGVLFAENSGRTGSPSPQLAVSCHTERSSRLGAQPTLYRNPAVPNCHEDAIRRNQEISGVQIVENRRQVANSGAQLYYVRFADSIPHRDLVEGTCNFRIIVRAAAHEPCVARGRSACRESAP